MNRTDLVISTYPKLESVYNNRYYKTVISKSGKSRPQLTVDFECDCCHSSVSIEWSTLKTSYLSTGSYFCSNCSGKKSAKTKSDNGQYEEIIRRATEASHTGEANRVRCLGMTSRTSEQYSDAAKKAAKTLGPEGLHNRALKVVSNRDNRALYENRVKNGTFMRSKLELQIEEIFGGQHSSPDFKMELDVYFPDKNKGIEIDDRSHSRKREGYHRDKLDYFNSLGIKVLFISLSPRAVRREGYSDWKSLVEAFLNEELDDSQLIMWDDEYHCNG